MRFGYSKDLAGNVKNPDVSYQDYNGNLKYQVDNALNTILRNQGNPDINGLPYSGRFIELGATNDVEFPIHHTLGSEYVVASDTSQWITVPTGSAISVLSEVFTVTGGTSTDECRMEMPTVIGNSYRVTVTLENIDGTSGVERFAIGIVAGTATGFNEYAALDFPAVASPAIEYDIEFTATTTTAYFQVITVNTGEQVKFSNYSIKQITNPNSYLTYYDFTDGLVTLGNSVDGGWSDNLSLLDFDFTNSLDNGFSMVARGIATDQIGSYKLETTSLSIDNGFFYSSGQEVQPTTGTAVAVVVDISEISFANSLSELSVSLTNIVGGQIQDTYTLIPSVGKNIFYLNTGASPSNDYIALYQDSNATVGDYIKITNIEMVYDYAVLPISTKYTLNSKTVNNFLTHTTPWSASDWTKINNNPNLIGKLALETTGATKTIPELDMVMDVGASADSYYMCSEKSGAYLVDSRVAYGSEELTVIPTYLSSGGDDFSTSGFSATSTTFSFQQTVLSGSTIQPEIRWTDTYSINKYMVDISITNITASPITLRRRGFNTTLIISDVVIPSGETLHINEIHNITAQASSFSILFDGSSTLVGVNASVSVKQVSAQPIANYASTIRTNADLQQKGIQTTAFVTNAAGVPESYSSNLLQFNGDSRYVDTGFMPPSDKAWEIDFVMECKADGIAKVSGALASLTVNKLFIGQHSDNGLYGYIGDSLTGAYNVPVSNGLHYIRLEFDGLGNGNFVIDNTTTYPYTASNYVYSGSESFFIGGASRLGVYNTGTHTLPIGILEYTERTRTENERNAYYAKLKTIYPSLL